MPAILTCDVSDILGVAQAPAIERIEGMGVDCRGDGLRISLVLIGRFHGDYFDWLIYVDHHCVLSGVFIRCSSFGYIDFSSEI